MVDRGIDKAGEGLERLKGVKHSGLNLACFDEKATLFDFHRASLDSYFCNNVGSNEELDKARFARKHRKSYDKHALDEIQVYLQAVKERWRSEGKPPKVRFLTDAEQQEWERQYPKPPEEGGEKAHSEPGRES